MTDHSQSDPWMASSIRLSETCPSGMSWKERPLVPRLGHAPYSLGDSRRLMPYPRNARVKVDGILASQRLSVESLSSWLPTSDG